jgi:hypothetical protein
MLLNSSWYGLNLIGDEMNTRIQELAKQTGYIWHASGDPKIYEFTPEKLDEFAELIVREVFAKIEDERFEIYQPVKESVMKHFGVKE